MRSSEVLRNAFVIPARTFAADMQRCRNASHTPTAAQQPGPVIGQAQARADRQHRDQMKKAAI